MRITLTSAQLRLGVAALLVLAAGLFSLGVLMEGSEQDSHTSEESAEGHDESEEVGTAEEGTEDEDSETLLGLDLERRQPW